MKDEEHETRELVEAPHPNNTAVGHLYAAKAELSALAHEAGRGPAGRCYSIVLTDLEKLIHVEAGYFPRGEARLERLRAALAALETEARPDTAAEATP